MTCVALCVVLPIIGAWIGHTVGEALDDYYAV